MLGPLMQSRGISMERCGGRRETPEGEKRREGPSW